MELNGIELLGQTMLNGLVITDGVDDNGKSTGNEWVWVPVENPQDLYEELQEPKQLGKYLSTDKGVEVFTTRCSKFRYGEPAATRAVRRKRRGARIVCVEHR